MGAYFTSYPNLHSALLGITFDVLYTFQAKHALIGSMLSSDTRVCIISLNRLVPISIPMINTVDGRNPSPVDRKFVPLFTRFYISQLMQDFFHQQYLDC